MSDRDQPIAAMTVIIASFLLLVTLAVLGIMVLLDPIP